MKHFVSIKRKLITNTMVTIAIIFAAVLAIITFINIQSADKNILKSEKNIRNALVAKGNTLTRNNSRAMTGMAEQNAILAIRELVASTVASDTDIVYGIYMDSDFFPWAYATAGNPSGVPETMQPLTDPISGWAGSLEQLGNKVYSRDDGEIMEFAAPVQFEGETLGSIRYGVSTASMHEAIREALSDGVRARNQTILILTAVCLLSLLAGFLCFRRLADKITQPISSLVESSKTIAGGNYNVPVTSDSDDELGLLVADVDTMRLAIKDLTDNLEAKVEERTEQLAEANKRIKSAMKELWGEMELAKKIQTVLLPVEPRLSGYDIAASLEPADEVGGDYYDVITVDDYKWIVIGDVSGHGVPAGLIMMMAQTAIHTALIENPDVPPSKLLMTINKIIAENIRRLGEMKYMTMTVLATYKGGNFSFAGLHQDILVYRAGTKTVDMIETRGFWLGIEADISDMVMVDELHLDLGDTMLLYTDGITEAVDSNEEMFGIERLIKVIEQSGHKSAQEIHDIVIDTIKFYQRPDDVTLVVIKRKQQPIGLDDKRNGA